MGELSGIQEELVGRRRADWAKMGMKCMNASTRTVEGCKIRPTMRVVCQHECASVHSNVIELCIHKGATADRGLELVVHGFERVHWAPTSRSV